MWWNISLISHILSVHDMNRCHKMLRYLVNPYDTLKILWYVYCNILCSFLPHSKRFVYCEFWSSFSYMFLQDIPNILCPTNLPYVCWMSIWQGNVITILVWKNLVKEVKLVAKDCLCPYPYGYVEILKKVLTTLILVRAALTRLWW